MATIKFKDLIGGELQNKIRSVKDLVNYVKNSPSSHPNYSIFLGAGASVTSGIKSGGHLVDTWRKEIYEQQGNNYLEESDEGTVEQKEEAAKQRAIDYLIRKHGSWYNPQNEYSSLFERKFDLPIQRRWFVEGLVDDHLPSIGYLYLITLINEGFFNTIFTTNFDDLVNEAFYQFSNTRPLICAHDSAVSSISVIAKRPKIIKLHGDYLFDDIKNTIKETESLEQNIKEKFIEFTKDNGLIIIGYSGQDRSILDVLNYLLQQENYLKNGLYWCFRPEDEISHEVRKILWKDKVYCVEINGFDEFFSEFSNHVEIKPNLIDNPKNSKREKCIEGFIDSYNKSENKNPLIKEFIEEISTARNNQDISDLIRQLNENNNSLSPEKLKGLLEVENLISKNKLDAAFTLIDDKLKEELDEDLKENYIAVKIRILNIKDNKSEAIKLIDGLIKEDEFNTKYHNWRLSFLTNVKEKINYLIDINKKIVYNLGLKNSLIKLFIFFHKNYDDKLDFTFIQCENLIKESLELDSSLDNEVYDLKMDFLKLKRLKEITKDVNKKTRTEKEQKNDSEIFELVEEAIYKNKYNLNCINLRRKYVIDKKDMNIFNQYIVDLQDIQKTVSNKMIMKLDSIISNVYIEIITTKPDEIKNIEYLNKKTIEDFFINYNEDDIKNRNISFLLEKTKYLMVKSTDSEIILNQLTHILSILDSFDYIKAICIRFTLMRDTKINIFLNDFISKNKSKMSSSTYYYCMYEIQASNLNYEESLFSLEKYYSIKTREPEDFTTYIYALLLAKRYDDIIEFISKNTVNINTLPKENRNIIKINSITASLLKTGELSNDDKSILEKIISKSNNDKYILICINSLLKNNSHALFHIKEGIDLDYTFYYQLQEWPAINKELKADMKKHFESKSSTYPKIEAA